MSATDALDRDGYVLLPDALDAGWIARLRLAFEVAADPGTGTRHVRLDDGTPGLEAWEALRSHPQVLALAARVLGGPARVRDLHGRDPLPGFGLQGLHADAKPRTPGEGFSVATAIWMIDDFTAENGATRVVPGSHRWIRPPTREMAQPQAHHGDERVITGKAGAVLLFNGHLWHAGTQNLTGGSRRAGQMVMVRA